MNVNLITQSMIYSNAAKISEAVTKGAENVAKEIKLKNLYGTGEIGKIKIGEKFYTVKNTANEYFSLRANDKSCGEIILCPRMYEGKECYSVSEVQNFSNDKGVGTRLMQLGLKAHKDSGKLGEYRAHDVILEAEEFYEKLGFIEDEKRCGQWFLPKENEHILENKFGGLQFFD